MKRWQETRSLAHPTGAWGNRAGEEYRFEGLTTADGKKRHLSAEESRLHDLNALILQATKETMREGLGETSWSTGEEGKRARHVLAILSHCYIRGIYNSNDVAGELRRATEARGYYEQHWPDAAGIRRFRRLNRDLLLKSLEKIFRLFGERNILWPMVSLPALDAMGEPSAEGRGSCEHREAEARLEHAILHDRAE